MTRLHEWPELLNAYVAAHRATPFEWGVHDCCRFAAGAIQAITGTDPMAQFSYTTEAEARALIESAGGIEALVTSVLGDPLPSVAQAQRGDVLLADLPTPSIGTCLGATTAFVSERGLLLVRTNRARMAWRVG